MTTKINVPSADLGRDLDLNVSEIYYAESRFDEIAIINTHKAPELISCFVKAYAWCVEHITNLTAEAVKAETAADFRKAELILEEVPRVLKEKGIKTTNDDYRKAVIAMDKKHIVLRDRLNHIEMYKALFKGKLESIDRAYMAVRKIYGSGMDFRNPNLGSNHTPEQPWEPPVDLKTKTISVSGRYQEDSQARPMTGGNPVTINTVVRSGFGWAKE